MRARTDDGLWRGDVILIILDWILDEQLAGRRPNDVSVAKHFDMPLEEVIALHEHLEEIGEL